ncbi:hypothetical protein PIB30_069589, partial [Stylosanthes scabra]|nr:hypothetical protein [Stylosanthes scabra]
MGFEGLKLQVQKLLKAIVIFQLNAMELISIGIASFENIMNMKLVEILKARDKAALVDALMVNLVKTEDEVGSVLMEDLIEVFCNIPILHLPRLSHDGIKCQDGDGTVTASRAASNLR